MITTTGRVRKGAAAAARRGAVLVFCLAAAALTGPVPARSGIVGSRHDFSSSPAVAPQGACTGCHLPHFAGDTSRLWSRSLADERGFFIEVDTPNYVPPPTLLCYDCHDDNATTAGPAVDDDPPKGTPPTGSWASGLEPQDVAFGYLYSADLSTPPVNVPDDDGANGTVTGYYELIDGKIPAPKGDGSLPAAGDPTGGHYWKSDPNGAPVIGDKIACTVCHDPHKALTGDNEVFLRRTAVFPDGSTAALGANGLKASAATDLSNPNRSRYGTGTGREMCAACHGYSDSGSQVSFGGGFVPEPPLSLTQHRSGNGTPCTKCHSHNKIEASCNDCHGFPPLRSYAEAGNHYFAANTVYADAENYDDGAGVHRRHMDVLGAALFECEICRGADAGSATWHNEGAGVVTQANVDIRGMTTYWGAGSSYNGVATGGDATSAFGTKGGGDQRCAGLTCHGQPPNIDGALNWTDKMVNDTTGAAVSIEICKWCHDGTPARIGAAGAWAPNVLGDNDGTAGTWASGTWGADVNGHGLTAGNYEGDLVGEATRLGKPAANKLCTVCHDARYTTLALPALNTPVKPHFNATATVNKRLNDTINDVNTIADNPDNTCAACHQVTTGPDRASEHSLVVSHGNSAADGYRKWETVSFSRSCRQCHEPHGANWNGVTPLPRNLHMIGKWVDVNGNGQPDGGVYGAEAARVDSNATNNTANIDTNDIPVITKSAGGSGMEENSWDDGNNDGRTPADSLCVVCHVSLENGHSQLGDSVAQGAGHLNVGTRCRLCHQHGELSTHPNKADDAFGPLSCFACHGTAPPPFEAPSGELAGQFWPDGRASAVPEFNYSNDQKGAHRKHIDVLASKVFNETAAQLVTSYSGANPTLTSFEKQVAICWFCHYDPGGSDIIPDPAPHFDNSTTDNSPLNRVDVLQGGSALHYFKKFTTGTHPTYGRTNFTDDTSGGAYTFGAAGTGTCANLVCHNQAATPGGANDWNNPPTWTASATCSATTCHATSTYTNAHSRHVGTAQKGYACTECHADNATVAPLNPIPLGHGDGKVDMRWNNAGSIEAGKGADAFYDKEPGGVASPNDTGFAYKTPPYNVACSLVYCHGGDNAGWGGGDGAPVWDDSEAVPGGVYCGSCHGGNATAPPNGDSSVIASGNHTDHLSAAWGPNWGTGGCLGTPTTGCHTAFDTSWVPSFVATHVNGTVEFANIAATPAASPLGTLAANPATATDTDRCTHCHSSAVVTVFDAAGTAVGPTSGTQLVKTKANWDNTAYQVPCLTCHNGTDAGANFADGTGRAAPDMLGTDLPGQSGAEVRGHGLTTGTYPYPPPVPASPNPGANKYCTACHDTAVAHLNNSNDTSFTPGNRMLTAIEGFTLPAQNATEVCKSCHSRAASTATKKNVNQHSNADYPPPSGVNQGRLEGVFTAPECMQCHDPHGMTANGTGYNIYMVPSTITVVPGATPVTVANVRFEYLAGDYSFNDMFPPGGTDDLCVVCHVNAGNPGNPMVNVTGDGRHYINNVPANPLAYYDGDERRHNCAGCHPHNRDNNLATADGFMPVACNACHSYPGLAVNAGTHVNSATHDLHAGEPVTVPVNNYAFRCNTCHYANNHNETGMDVGAGWAPLNASVNIRFDPARNGNAGGNPTYATVNAFTQSAPGVGGTGACAFLYCHGNGTNGTNGGNLAFPAAFQGSSQTPQWSLTAPTRTCVTCHEFSSSTPPIGTVAHPKHVGPVVNGGYAIGCQVCHYGTTADGATVAATGMPIHVNGSVEVSFNVAADTRVDGASVYNNAGNTAIGAPYYSCSATYCHSQGTDRDQAGGFPDDAAQALVWGTASTCASCHGNGVAAAAPAYADGTPKANKHAIHTGTGDPQTTRDTNGYECRHCHYPTTHDNGTAVFSSLYHVNGSYDVDDDNAAVAPENDFDSFTYTAGTPGSCAAVTCHGGTAASWGATSITCDTCHANTAGVKTGVADVNEFNGRSWVQSKINDQPGGEYGTRGHGAKGVLCAGCHDGAVGHDVTTPLSGADPYRLGGGFTCRNTAAGCHASGAPAAVANHSEASMSAASIPPQRGPWPWTPECVNCHDPHGDSTNLSMIQRELYDKVVFNLTGAAPAPPTEQQNLVFTDAATGITPTMTSFADSAVFSSICQECHEAGNMVSFKDGGPDTTVDPHAGFPNGNPGNCSYCHTHSSGFAPARCEPCHDPTPHPGIPGGAPAPNVMSYYTTSGHGKATPAVECEDCHNISLPALKHLDGTVDGHTPSSNNANPFHLVTGFIASSPSSEWNAQVTFDNNCWAACHDGNGGTALTTDMRHGKDSDPAPNALRLGDNNSYTTIRNTPPPDMFLDRNITWLGGYDGAPYFVLCVTCHNPHGTGVTSPRSDGNNKMVIYRWMSPLCNKCHS